MQHREVVHGEPAPLHQGHGQRVAHGQGGGGGRGGGQPQRAGLLADGDVEVDVGGGGQGGARLPRHGQEGRAQPLHLRHQGQDLPGVAAVGDGQHRVSLDDAAQVAVDGLGRMQEERGRARGGEGGRDLLSDQAALAHPGDDHAARAGEQRLHRTIEALVDARQQLEDGPRLDLQDLARDLTGHAAS